MQKDSDINARPNRQAFVNPVRQGRTVQAGNHRLTYDPIIYRYSMRIVKQDGTDKNLSRRLLPVQAV